MARPQSIHKMEDAELSTINMMIYGHPGEGKTPFWGTGGEGLLLMDSDNGYESAMATGSKAHRAPATTYDEVTDVYEWLKNDVCKGRGPELMPEFEFQWVVWDSLTLFQDRTLIDDLMETAINDRSRVGSEHDRWVPSMREYRVDHNRISTLVRQFVSLPINFGISCHVLVDSDQEGHTIWMPSVQGKGMASKVSGYMNVVGMMGHTPEKKTPRILFQQGETKFYARDRFMALGNHMDNPTVPKIVSAIDAKRNGQGNPAAATPIRRRRRRAS